MDIEEFILEVKRISNNKDFENNKEELKTITKGNYFIVTTLLRLGYDIQNSIKAIYYFEKIELASTLTKKDAIDILPNFMAICSLNNINTIWRSEQLVSFLKWVGDGYDFENNAEEIVKQYISEGN